jgi:hypothetical protein
MKKRTVFGLPITPIRHIEELRGSSFCVSYATRNRLGRQLDDAIDAVAADGILMLDNGAFSAWRSNVPMDVDGFARWAAGILERCEPAVAVVPDVIDGTEAANDEMIEEFFGACFELGLDVPRCRCMVVWHMHESIDRLLYLVEGYSYIAIGSSGEYAKIGTPAWHARIAEAMAAIDAFVADSEGAYSRPWVHMMRAQSEAHRYDFDSADSCNVAVNHCRYKSEGPGHVARLAGRVAAKIDASCDGAERHGIDAPRLNAELVAADRELAAAGDAADYRAALERFFPNLFPQSVPSTTEELDVCQPQPVPPPAAFSLAIPFGSWPTIPSTGPVSTVATAAGATATFPTTGTLCPPAWNASTGTSSPPWPNSSTGASGSSSSSWGTQPGSG